MVEPVTINGHKIGKGYPPYIVAEISANHNGELSQAITLINKAKKAGAQAVKLQTYTPETITLNHRSPDFIIQSGLWKGQTLYDCIKRLIHRGIGMKNSSTMRKRLVLPFFQARLTKRQ